MKLPIAKEGLFYSALAAVATILLIFVSLYAAAIAFICCLFCLYFFRDPSERAQPNEGEILSPAYGTVCEIKHEQIAGIEGRSQKIGIFLSVFDVHLTYAPTDGVVTRSQYQKGKFCNALNAKAAEVNECNWLDIQNDKGVVIVVKQIAGLIARRIICSLKKGSEVHAGDKIGLIQFGSRVDIWVPEGVRLNVKKGDRVKGGVTVIGRVL